MMRRTKKGRPFIADRKVILIILAGAIVVRIFFGLVMGDKLNFYDTIHYDTAAQSILKFCYAIAHSHRTRLLA